MESEVIEEQVLVPFVFGVIYIEDAMDAYQVEGFSPLRFWGYLYP